MIFFPIVLNSFLFFSAIVSGLPAHDLFGAEAESSSLLLTSNSTTFKKDDSDSAASFVATGPSAHGTGLLMAPGPTEVNVLPSSQPAASHPRTPNQVDLDKDTVRSVDEQVVVKPQNPTTASPASTVTSAPSLDQTIPEEPKIHAPSVGRSPKNMGADSNVPASSLPAPVPSSTEEILPTPQARETLSLMDCTLNNEKTTEIWWVNSTNANNFTDPQSPPPLKAIVTTGSFLNYSSPFTFPFLTMFTSDAPSLPKGRVPRGQYSLDGNGSMIKDTQVGVQQVQISYILGEIIRPSQGKGQTCHYIGYVDFFIAEPPADQDSLIL